MALGSCPLRADSRAASFGLPRLYREIVGQKYAQLCGARSAQSDFGILSVAFISAIPSVAVWWGDCAQFRASLGRSGGVGFLALIPRVRLNLIRSF